MEDEANLKFDYGSDDEEIYNDEVFDDFLNKTKENLANLSLNRNASAPSEEDNADAEFIKFLGSMRAKLSKHSEERCASHFSKESNGNAEFMKCAGGVKHKFSSEVSRIKSDSDLILMKDDLPCDIQRSQSVSSAFQDNQVLEEKQASSLHSLQKIENKLTEDYAKYHVVGSKKLYKVFNEKIFDSKLPKDMELEWSADLRTTAGKTCAIKKGNRYVSCKIILSSKVLTTFERLRDTLLHEMCHAAVFLMSQVHGENHGPLWKTWAVRCNLVLPDIEIPQRCHSYDLSYPYNYKCNNCEWKCGRYQRSEKLSKALCPKCRSSLSLVKS